MPRHRQVASQSILSKLIINCDTARRGSRIYLRGGGDKNNGHLPPPRSHTCCNEYDFEFIHYNEL